MKLRFAILPALMTMAVNCFATDDWANLGRFKEENRVVVSREDKNDHLVVFMGNSITEIWPELDLAFFTDNNFVGRGISGQTTYQMLLRFYSDVIDLKPEAVVICGGINDIAENNYEYDELRTLSNLKAMAEIAEANGIKVIMASVLPADRFKWRPEMKDIPPKVISLNEKIKRLAEEKGYAYVDYFSRMENPSTHGMNAEFTKDGVHPNLKGYKEMEEIVLPIICKVTGK